MPTSEPFNTIVTMADRGHNQQERLAKELHHLFVFDLPYSKAIRLAQFDLGIHNGYTMTAYIESDAGSFYWNGFRFINTEGNDALYPSYDDLPLQMKEVATNG